MRKSYEERQAECGLKVGDIVKISRKAEEYEGGWGNVWPEKADTWVGKTGEIIGDGKVCGFKVFLEEEKNWWFFPYFVLEKVEDEVTEKAKEPKSYKERQAECGLKVGDKVKILRKVGDFEDGWGNVWPEKADTWVGKTGEIIGDGKVCGFKVSLEEEKNGCFFPYFVLEKVEEKKLTRYSVFTMRDQGKDFFLIPATSKEETSESIIFTEKSGGTWEFYKKHIIAIKTI